MLGDTVITIDSIIINSLCTGKTYDFKVHSTKLVTSSSGSFYLKGPAIDSSYTLSYPHLYCGADSIIIFPDPVCDTFLIQGDDLNYYTLEIFNENDSLIQTLIPIDDEVEIDISGLPIDQNHFLSAKHDIILNMFIFKNLDW